MSFKTFKTCDLRPGHAAGSRPRPQLQQTSKVTTGTTTAALHRREAFEIKKKSSELLFLKASLTALLT